MNKKNTQKVLLALFFTVHLSLVFFQALWTTIDGYWHFHHNESPNIPLLNILKQNRNTEPYYIFTGTNTGYGFYGIKTSTEKYFRATYFDSQNNVLKTDRYFGLSTSNGVSRLGTYASFLTNYISDTEKMVEIDSTRTGTIHDRINFRKDYAIKALTWLGKKHEDIRECASYKVELITIVPTKIQRINTKNKPKLYVVQDIILKSEKFQGAIHE